LIEANDARDARADRAGFLPVHGLFAADPYEESVRAGARVVTCHTAHHHNKTIDVHGVLDEILRML
jgi:hypothetical protein